MDAVSHIFTYFLSSDNRLDLLAHDGLLGCLDFGQHHVLLFHAGLGQGLGCLGPGQASVGHGLDRAGSCLGSLGHGLFGCGLQEDGVRVLLLALCLLGYRMTIAQKMVRQYPWLYQAAGPLGWKSKG